jgi:hypothetical protein
VAGGLWKRGARGTGLRDARGSPAPDVGRPPSRPKGRAGGGGTPLYACVGTYRGVRSSEEAARRVEEGFRPVLEAAPGFGGYHAVASGDTLTAVSLLATREGAAASAGLAAGRVRENLADLYGGGPPGVVPDRVMLAVAA